MPNVYSCVYTLGIQLVCKTSSNLLVARLRCDWLQTGQTGLSIAQRLGYISVIEILRHVTEVQVDSASLEEKYKVIAPETMQEAPMSDSEEEAGENLLPRFFFPLISLSCASFVV